MIKTTRSLSWKGKQTGMKDMGQGTRMGGNGDEMGMRLQRGVSHHAVEKCGPGFSGGGGSRH